MTIPHLTCGELARASGCRLAAGDPATVVTAVTHDSREARPGACFVAVNGFKRDGVAFVPEALRRGATAFLVAELDAPRVMSALPPTVALLADDDPRAALPRLAAALYRHPARSLLVVGVTGTDGKTTTCYAIAHLLRAAGWRGGLVSGVDIVVDGAPVLNRSGLTTPEAPVVQDALAGIRDAGGTFAVLEATSHALSLHRLDECQFDVAVFTNLTPDHLDFHRTVADYAATKARLFAMLDAPSAKPWPRLAIGNAASPWWPRMRSATSRPALTYGIGLAADLAADEPQLSAAGARFTVAWRGTRREVRTRLLGRFNVENALATMATGLALGLPWETVSDAIGAFPGSPGRMEIIDLGQPFTCVVDAASTADSFRQALATLRPLTRSRLIVVFGCAGERDPARRDGMGAVAAELADFAVLTDENPRTEDRMAIIHRIAAAMEAGGRRERVDYVKIADRRAAIVEALRRARPGDLVLLAGKGREPTLIFAETAHPWDDRTELERALRDRGFAAPRG